MFDHIGTFEGDSAKYKAFLFDLLVAIGRVDKALEDGIRGFLKYHKDKNEAPEDWRGGSTSSGLDRGLWEAYRGELYGILVSKTSGKAKGIMRGLSEVGETDGFKALLIFDKRFDIRTSAYRRIWM